MTVGLVSRIGFGASGLGTMYAPMSDEQAHGTLTAAYSAGFRSFDTAPLYGHGLSELRLGRFLRSVPRDSFTLSTKMGHYLVPPRRVAAGVFNSGILATASVADPSATYDYAPAPAPVIARVRSITGMRRSPRRQAPVDASSSVTC